MNYTKIILYKKGGAIIDFASARNQTLKKAKSEWIFFVDTDEKVSKDLENEILKLVQDDKIDGYFIKRIDYFFGRWLKFGETGNIKLLRLGKKGAGIWRRRVHEFWDIKNAGKLKNPLFHYPKWSIGKINQYSDIDAKEFSQFRFYDVILKPIGKFILNYFLKLGFLDGLAGYIHAYLMSFQSLVVRVKQYDFIKTS